MEKKILIVEAVLADESFLGWYFNTSEETVRSWEKWVTMHPEHHLLVDEAVKFMGQVELVDKELPGSQVEAATGRLKDAIAMQQDAVPVVSIKRSRKRWWMPVAAAVLFLVAGGIFWKYSRSGKETITASYGQLSQNQLPDGSEVLLNANSSVVLGKNWKDERDREVWLKGEAFFHVKKTSTHSKFIVHTSKFDIIVRGTQFNVCNYEDKANVMLTEGSIMLKTDDGKEVLMKPGEFREFSSSSKQVEAKLTKQEAVLAWKDKKLVFDNTSLKEVAKIITEHYGVEVKIADDELGNKTLTGIWPNDDLNTLLQAIEATQDFKVARSKDSVTFEKP